MFRIGLIALVALLAAAPAYAGGEVGPRYTAQECCEYVPCDTPPCATCPECPEPAPAPEPQRVRVYSRPPVGDAYDDLQSHPLRVLAYLVHPVGYTAEWLLTRPFHKVVSQPDLEPVFGHHRHDFYGGTGGSPIDTELATPAGSAY